MGSLIHGMQDRKLQLTRLQPGSELPWRVIVISVTDAKKAIAALPSAERSNVKKKRCGKKRRIAIRKKTAGKAEKKRLEKMSQVEKEAAEKEKRTRRNREKKVKKRNKKKENKADVTNEPV